MKRTRAVCVCVCARAAGAWSAGTQVCGSSVNARGQRSGRPARLLWLRRGTHEPGAPGRRGGAAPAPPPQPPPPPPPGQGRAGGTGEGIKGAGWPGRENELPAVVVGTLLGRSQSVELRSRRRGRDEQRQYTPRCAEGNGGDAEGTGCRADVYSADYGPECRGDSAKLELVLLARAIISQLSLRKMKN